MIKENSKLSSSNPNIDKLSITATQNKNSKPTNTQQTSKNQAVKTSSSSARPDQVENKNDGQTSSFQINSETTPVIQESVVNPGNSSSSVSVNSEVVDHNYSRSNYFQPAIETDIQNFNSNLLNDVLTNQTLQISISNTVYNTIDNSYPIENIDINSISGSSSYSSSFLNSNSNSLSLLQENNNQINSKNSLVLQSSPVVIYQNAMNQNYTTWYDPGFNLLEVIIMTSSSTLASLFTVIGNLLVIIAFIINKQLRTINNYLIINLAIADFMIGLLSMNLYTVMIIQGGWFMGDFLCKFWLILDYVCSQTSSLNLLIICVDRYLSVQYAVWYRNKRSVKHAITAMVGVWTMSIDQSSHFCKVRIFRCVIS